ncbi:capsule assembly Wzi family protein [Marinilongibacter aquaticus]|uniref:capsule assembly Wzi family protein n=1 Tax=Marinilongibacter aquaticus TaxID=2975157 RepID=UPI0021BDA8B2|nr:capsule assembly Wzi family protein [Marinilongibacter aquaticus]UBM57652.1 capsule assembly Wzi family protein [Marinilongibacter aquaticus]
MRSKILGLFFFFSSILAFSQESARKGEIAVEASGILSSTNNTPFFLRANHYGENPREAPIMQLAGEYHQEYDSLYTNKKKLKGFNYGYGIRAVGNVGQTNQLLLPEIYGKVRLGIFEFSAGRRKEVFGLMDTTGTSGSYIWSGNALPIPKLQVSLPNYVPIVKSGLISIKGNFAHGWFGNTDSVQHALLHQKSLYVRIGKPQWKFKFQAGFNHQVQWGGKPTVPFYDEDTKQMISKFSSDFATFVKVVTGVSLNRNLNAINDPNGAPANEALNRAGNHLGTIDLALSYEFKTARLLLYRQSIYEDGSLFYLSNIGDGLNGLSVKFKYPKKTGFLLSAITFEYLNTMSQGGPTDSENFVPELRGLDNYFNNSIYRDGWTYKGTVIGTPFIQNYQDLPKKLAEDISRPLSNYIYNNRIEAYYLKIKAEYKTINLALRYAFSTNYGTYSYPFSSAKRNSVGISGSKMLRNGDLIKCHFALDEGKLYPSQVGAQITYKKFFSSPF